MSILWVGLLVPLAGVVNAHPAAATSTVPDTANAVIPTSSSPGTSPSLINNYQEVTFGPNDDGTWPCGPDDVSGPVACTGSETGPELYPIGFNINFFGTEFDSVYINNNGNVTFDSPLSEFTPTSLTTFGSPILAPFFADVDTRGATSGVVNFGTGTLNGQNVFVVNWPNVGCYDENDTVLNNFQMVLIDRPDRGTGPNGDDFDIEYNYDSIQWDTGQASSGDDMCQNGADGESAFVGYSNGTSTAGDSYNLPGSGVPNSFLDSTTTTGLIYNSLNSTVLGRYIFTVSNGQPTNNTTLSTSLSGDGQSGATITVPPETAVTDNATISNGTDDQNETGTITYNVYSDPNCSDLVSGGTAENITTPGTLPASQPVTLSATGSYYWQAVYSGDSQNNGSVGQCGSEVETVGSSCYSGAWPSQVNGVPTVHPDGVKGFYIGVDPTSGQWTMEDTHRQINPRQFDSFTATVTTDGTFSGVQPIMLEKRDSVSVSTDQHTLTYVSRDGGSIDGVSFTPTCGSTITFELDINGTATPVTKIFLGVPATSPSTNPVTFTRSS